MNAYPPMTSYLTLLSLKSLNRSLKSQLTNIQTLDLACANNQLTGAIETRLRSLFTPKLQIE